MWNARGFAGWLLRQGAPATDVGRGTRRATGLFHAWGGFYFAHGDGNGDWDINWGDNGNYGGIYVNGGNRVATDKAYSGLDFIVGMVDDVNDVAKLWVNPLFGLSEPTPDLTATFTGTISTEFGSSPNGPRPPQLGARNACRAPVGGVRANRRRRVIRPISRHSLDQQFDAGCQWQTA